MQFFLHNKRRKKTFVNQNIFFFMQPLQWWTRILCIVGQVEGIWSVTAAVGIVVNCHVSHVTWHLTHKTFFYLVFPNKFGFFLVFVLLFAHIEIFSVSHNRHSIIGKLSAQQWPFKLYNLYLPSPLSQEWRKGTQGLEWGEPWKVP